MSDNIIRFPGAAKPGTASSPDTAAAPGESAPGASTPTGAPPLGADGLTDDQRKAMQVILSGMSFILVGIKPTDRGADFFTAVHGEAHDLRNAQPHLDGVIARAYARKGLG
jgi:hypothetical protein